MDDIIEIDGIEYVIAKRVEYKNDIYLYVISDEEENVFSILKETTYDNGEVYVESVNDEELVKEILALIADEGL